MHETLYSLTLRVLIPWVPRSRNRHVGSREYDKHMPWTLGVTDLRDLRGGLSEVFDSAPLPSTSRGS